MKYGAIILFLVWHIVYSYGQTRFKTGALPLLNATVPVSEEWKLNIRSETRVKWAESMEGGPLEENLDFELHDASVSMVKKLKLTNSIAFGMLVRQRKGTDIIRFSQQYVITKNQASSRLAHRVLTDQSFGKDLPPRLRLRYRISSEWPLNGQKVDRGEAYLKLNHEWLNEWQDSEYDLELRLVPAIGFKFRDSSKLEFSLDYRVDSFISNKARHILWQSLSWYIVI